LRQHMQREQAQQHPLSMLAAELRSHPAVPALPKIEPQSAHVQPLMEPSLMESCSLCGGCEFEFDMCERICMTCGVVLPHKDVRPAGAANVTMVVH